MLKARLIAAGVFLLGILLAIWKAVSTGRRLEKADQMEGTLDAIKERDDLDRELDDPVARRKLRDKHYRD